MVIYMVAWNIPAWSLPDLCSVTSNGPRGHIYIPEGSKCGRLGLFYLFILPGELVLKHLPSHDYM